MPNDNIQLQQDTKDENLIQNGSEEGFANHNSAYLGPVVEDDE